jgi:hypothetical protein
MFHKATENHTSCSNGVAVMSARITSLYRHRIVGKERKASLPECNNISAGHIERDSMPPLGRSEPIVLAQDE